MTASFAFGFMAAGPELLILAGLIVVLFFGPQKIPELAQSMGEATREWKNARSESPDTQTVRDEINSEQ